MTPQAEVEGQTAQGRHRWRVWLNVVGLCIGAGILLWQLVRAGQAIAAQPEILPGWPRLVLLVLCAMASHAVQMSAWRYLMRIIGAPLPWRAVFGGYMVSFLPRYIPGSAWGYLSRGVWFARYGVPASLSAVGALLETLSIVGSGMGLALGYLFDEPWLAALGPIVTTLLCCAGPALLSRYPGRWGAVPLRNASVLEACAQVCMTSVIWLLFGAMTRIALPGASQMDLLTASTSYYVGWLGGALAVFVPAGLGVREVAIGATLATFGVSSTQALAVPALIRLAMLISECFWICLALALKTPENKAYPNG